MAGQYKQPVQYGRESAHKSRVARAPSSLGDYMFKIHHINEEENILNEEENVLNKEENVLNEEENVLISGTRRTAVRDSAEPKQ